MRRPTIPDLMQRVWNTREDLVKDFKRHGYPVVGADYMPGEMSDGTWKIIDRADADPLVSDVPAAETEPATGTHGGETPARAPRKRQAARQPAAAPAPGAVPGAADGPPAGPNGAYDWRAAGGPNPDKLPEGFETWAIEMATRDQGVTRRDLHARTKMNCKWFAYLKDVGQRNGFYTDMKRDGRGNVFRMVPRISG